MLNLLLCKAKMLPLKNDAATLFWFAYLLLQSRVKELPLNSYELPDDIEYLVSQLEIICYYNVKLSF